MCASVSPSSSPVHYLALALPFTSLLWTLVTRPCGRRWERSRSTKELTAINFAQATFTIIQRDSRLIAVTLSPRRALRPSRRPPLVLCEYQQADSHFVFVWGAERKRVGEEESHFCISKRCDVTPPERTITACQGRLSMAAVMSVLQRCSLWTRCRETFWNKGRERAASFPPWKTKLCESGRGHGGAPGRITGPLTCRSERGQLKLATEKRKKDNWRRWAEDRSCCDSTPAVNGEITTISIVSNRSDRLVCLNWPMTSL